MSYEGENVSNHWFLPRKGINDLVEVTHVYCPDSVKSCINRRRLSTVEMTKTFFRHLRTNGLPLDAYVIDKNDSVTVKLEERPSVRTPLTEVVRNESRIDLECYRNRWIEECVDVLTCGICND